MAGKKSLFRNLSCCDKFWFLLIATICPFGLLLWLCFSLGYGGQPIPRNRKLNISRRTVSNPNTRLNACQALVSFLFHCCPIGLNFTSKLSMAEAINRYEEIDPPETKNQLFQHLATNEFLILILHILNERKSRFFFKILPSGSLREGFGKSLPSTSVLATDYDLMLVPDAVHVQLIEEVTINPIGINNDDEVEGRRNGNSVIINVESDDENDVNDVNDVNDDKEDDCNFKYEANTGKAIDEPPVFHILADPKENPETPDGFLWLKLANHELKEWKELCYARQFKGKGNFACVFYY